MLSFKLQNKSMLPGVDVILDLYITFHLFQAVSDLVNFMKEVTVPCLHVFINVEFESLSER